MSNLGPPGGPPDPWDGQPGEAHPPPADPRRTPGYPGQPGTWRPPRTDQRYAPQYEPPTQRYEQPAGWATGQPAGSGPGDPPYPEPSRPKRGRGRLVAALAVVVLLLLGGAAAFWVSRREAPRPVSAPGGPTSAAADPTAEANEPAGPATTAAAPASSTDPRFVKAGQCVRNDGGTARPKLVITECGPKTYEVLSRIDGPTSGEQDAEAKCAEVAGYTDWFFYNSDLDTLDFVLCLKQR